MDWQWQRNSYIDVVDNTTIKVFMALFPTSQQSCVGHTFMCDVVVMSIFMQYHDTYHLTF